jgi:hypothetical protein
MYYTSFDVREEHELDAMFPDDGVPAGLNFQDLDESDYVTELTPAVFQDWLSEGRHNCDLAQAALRVWTYDLRGSANDTLHDFFTLLLDEYIETQVGERPLVAALPVLFLATWLFTHCSIAATFSADNDEDKITEVAEMLVEEVAIVQAYTTAWRGSGTVEAPAAVNAADAVRAEAAQRVLPWPSISEVPVPEMSDGRLVKAHPLTFPTGCGDFRQPRLRTDFTPLDWTQHVFRFFDGRVVTSLRGQRAVWAVFNTAMREPKRQPLAQAVRRARSHKSFSTGARRRATRSADEARRLRV